MVTLKVFNIPFLFFTIRHTSCYQSKSSYNDTNSIHTKPKANRNVIILLFNYHTNCCKFFC